VPNFVKREQGWCDRSSEDAYSSMAPDPTTIVTRDLCKLGFDCELLRLIDLDTNILTGLFRLPDVDILILIADCFVTDPDSQILE
jgi:hypothetical protein